MRLSIGRRRKQLCEKAHEVHAHLAGLCAHVPSAETQLDRERARAWCIAQVDPIRREVAERNLMCDETLEMIARQQGEPIGTARSQLARAEEMGWSQRARVGRARAVWTASRSGACHSGLRETACYSTA